MIKQTTLYRADLFLKENVGTAEQRQDIINDIEKKRAQFPRGMENSNPGCYRIGTPCTNINWLMDEINELLVRAVDFYSTEDPIFKNIASSSNASINYWANINEPNSRNTMHSHRQEHFSVVYYVEAENTGELRYTNPANTLGDCNFKAPFMRDFYYPPKAGDLILWPSWVPHEVEPNYSNNRRINLTFDIKIKP